jgi:hypothetical protein
MSAGLNSIPNFLKCGHPAKAESEYLSAQMNYRIALSELKIRTGKY